MRKLAIALTVVALATLAFSPAWAGTVNVTSNITTSETWTSNNEYILDRVIYVTNGATLTIEPGTVIRGEPESAPGANDPGTLVITRGSKIFAMGTAQNPIVMTNLDDDNVGPGTGTFPYDSLANARSVTGTWGGLILLGRGYVSNNTVAGPDPNRQIQVEGLTATGQLGFYGNGGDDDDDSGVINYLSIRYGGFNLSANNEINGLTLGAVGRATDIDYVEVYQNKDDCAEMFGGTAQLKHIACIAGGDDGLDYDEGWRGKAQFVLNLQGTPGSDKSDKGGEHDGGNGGDGSQPYALPTIYNATYIGLGQKGFSSDTRNTGLHIRDNAGGIYVNSAFLDFGGAFLIIEGDPNSATTSAARAVSPVGALPNPGLHPGLDPNITFQLELKNSTFWCNDPNLPGGIPSTGLQAETYGGDTGKSAYDNGVFTNAGNDNDLLGCGDPLPIRALSREPSGSSTTPDPFDFVDPRLDPNGPLATTDRVAPNDGFFDQVSYRGAFDATSNWASGWTNLARLGAFPAVANGDTIPVSSNITTSETWTANNEYVLENVVYVTNGATLTIEPGTVIRGAPESAPGANDPGTLVITRGSKLMAMGTPENPIVMTNLDDDNVHGNPGTFPYDTVANARSVTGTWGGLILLGDAYVSYNTVAGPDPSRQVQIEGLTATGQLGFYGNGGDDDDDSGVIRNLSLRYGGFNLSANNEINGLTLGAVGRTTEIDYVEIFQNKDDCSEMFGGTAQLKHIACVGSGDDGLDYDEGWRGKAQFYLNLQGTPGSDKSDKGGEHDGGGSGDGSQPYALPTIYNATYIGLGQKGFSSDTRNTALHIRDNAGGTYVNSAFLDFGGAFLIIEGDPNSATTSAARAVSPVGALPNPGLHPGLDPNITFQLELKNSTFWCNDPNLPGGIPTTGLQAETFGGDTGKDAYDNGVFTNAGNDNDLLGCAVANPIRGLTRDAAGITVPDPPATVDPRLDPNGPMAFTARVAPSDGFFEPAPHRGAFRSGSNWAQGWTNLAALGYFGTCSGGSAKSIPDEPRNIGVGGPLQNDTSRITWELPAGFVGDESYDVLRSSDASDFTTATCVESGDTDLSATDSALPSLNETYFYVVRADNSCGDGTVGIGSDGAERAATSCP